MPELPEVETALRGVTPYLKVLPSKNGSAPTPITLGGFSRINNAQNVKILDTSSSCEISHYSYRKKVTSLVI